MQNPGYATFQKLFVSVRIVTVSSIVLVFIQNSGCNKFLSRWRKRDRIAG